MRASSRWQRRRVFLTDSRDLGAPLVPLVAILCQFAWPEYNLLRRSQQPIVPGPHRSPRQPCPLAHVTWQFQLQLTYPRLPTAGAGHPPSSPEAGVTGNPQRAASPLVLEAFTRALRSPRQGLSRSRGRPADALGWGAGRPPVRAGARRLG